MNHLKLIIKREYFTKIRNKSFILMTFVSPIIFIALISFVAYLTNVNKDKKRIISILDQTGVFDQVFKDTANTKYHFIQNITLNQAKLLVEEREDYGLLYIPKVTYLNELSNQIKFFSEDSPSISLLSTIEKSIESFIQEENLAASGYTLQQIQQSKTNLSIVLESYQGKQTSKIDGYVKLGFGGAAGYLLFMFIIIYGNMIMRSVIEEKTSRIIEIIISSVKPIQLMLGKIIGTSLAGMTQFLIWITLGAVLLSVIPLFLDIDLSTVNATQQKLLEGVAKEEQSLIMAQHGFSAFLDLPLFNLAFAFLFFFLGGFLLYSSLYAAIGAAVDNETDTQQFVLPILMPLILAVYVGLFTVIEDPHGTISMIFSFIPFTSPVVMLMRIPFGVPLWQQVISFLILFTTFLITVYVASKIYRVGILMYGKKISYKELFRWLKY